MFSISGQLPMSLWSFKIMIRNLYKQIQKKSKRSSYNIINCLLVLWCACICGMRCSKIHTRNKETYNRKLEPLPNQDVVGIICPVFYSLRFQWVCTTNKTYSILNSHNALTLWMSGCVLGGYHLWLERGSGESLSNNGLHHYQGQHYHSQTME